MTDHAMRTVRDRWLANPDSAGAGAAFEAGWHARAEMTEGRATTAITALWEIVNHFGHVCKDFGYKTCRHRACDDSLNAWLTAHQALRDLGLIHEGQSFGRIVEATTEKGRGQ